MPTLAIPRRASRSTMRVCQSPGARSLMLSLSDGSVSLSDCACASPGRSQTGRQARATPAVPWPSRRPSDGTHQDALGSLGAGRAASFCFWALLRPSWALLRSVKAPRRVYPRSRRPAARLQPWFLRLQSAASIQQAWFGISLIGCLACCLTCCLLAWLSADAGRPFVRLSLWKEACTLYGT